MRYRTWLAALDRDSSYDSAELKLREARARRAECEKSYREACQSRSNAQARQQRISGAEVAHLKKALREAEEAVKAARQYFGTLRVKRAERLLAAARPFLASRATEALGALLEFQNAADQIQEIIGGLHLAGSDISGLPLFRPDLIEARLLVLGATPPAGSALAAPETPAPIHGGAGVEI
ncbi:hypothetical protein [Ferrovibrio sp.]|uniref:hypothetical protein n=1 Tax=Ferrovibrio sp. TaxID=1917215 RepID=UPI0035B1D23A